MEITLEIPDGTLCAYLNYIVQGNDNEMFLQCSLLDSSDLKDGAFIKIPRKEKTDDTEAVFGG